ncbi:MAG: AAA family ATPase [Parcubacteria group bacterium]|jgi:ATP-dependent Clp protease ATP-binding subunit ClpC
MPFRFAVWHYSLGIKRFFEIWKNFISYFWKHFSVALLLVTLISPWKKDISRSMQRGLHPIVWVNNLIENIITRILGAIIRFFVIISAIFLEILTFFSGAILFLIWLILPIIFLASLISFYLSLINGSGLLLCLSSTFFSASIILLFISIRSFKISNENYDLSNLSEIAHQKWFNRVWNRIGADSKGINLEILKNQQLLDEYLSKINLSRNEFDAIVEWELKNKLENDRKGRFWLKENLLSDSPIGKYWAFAYTVHLDKYADDLSDGDYSQYKYSELVGKEKDLSELKLLLTRPSQNNIILIGEEGVGRDTIVHTLAKKIRSMKAGEFFNKKRILSFNLTEIISKTRNKNEIDAILGNLFSEATYAGNIILFIKDIHQFLKNNPQNEGENISEVLSQFLAYPTFQIIGTTTPSEFHSNIEKNESVMKYCDKITIEEMSADNTLKVLLYKLKTEEKKRVIFTYQALRELIKLSERYISNSPFPEKALDIMEETMLYWYNNAYSNFITEEVVNEAVSQKIKVPLGEISEKEGEKLLDLENILHKRVIGQDFAIKQIAETMRRARVGMANEKKPLGSFLFLGPTGVGKTESSKALAEAYFGDENRMIRLDMSEYQTQDSIDRLIGSLSSGREGHLVSKIKENPYSILLLDEIEKADSNILNLFLQVLDEGNLTDVFGKKINFRNLIIIATSNAGSEIIRETIKEMAKPEETQEKVIDYVIKQGIFRPEFLNRFEGVIFFHPLDMETVLKISEMMLVKYAKKLRSNENISIEFDPEIAKIVAEGGYDATFGARNIERFFQDKIEDSVVKGIISGNIKKGSEFTFRKEHMEEG